MSILATTKNISGSNRLTSIRRDLDDVIEASHSINEDFDFGTGELRAPLLNTSFINTFGEASGDIGIFPSGTVSLFLTNTQNLHRQPSYFQDGSVANPSIGFESDKDTGLYSSAVGALDITCSGVDVLKLSDNKITSIQDCEFQDGYTVPNNLFSMFKVIHNQLWSSGIDAVCTYVQAPIIDFNLPNFNSVSYSVGNFNINTAGRYLINAQHVYQTSSSTDPGDEFNTYLTVNGVPDKLGWIRHTIQGTSDFRFFVRNTSFVYNFAVNDFFRVRRIQNSGASASFGYDVGSEYGYVSVIKLS